MRWTIDHFLKRVVMDHVGVVNLFKTRHEASDRTTPRLVRERRAYSDGPQIDDAEQDEEGQLVHGEHEGVEVVREGLEVAIERVEGVRGPRRRDCRSEQAHIPFVISAVPIEK